MGIYDYLKSNQFSLPGKRTGRLYRWEPPAAFHPVRHLMFCCICLLMLFSYATAAKATDKVVLQLAWKHQFQFAGYYAALHKGYYGQAGLDVVIVEGGRGRFAREEVLNGRAQYGVAGSELLLHRMEGSPFVVLAPIFQHSPSILLTREDSGISNPQDLIGKRVMLLPGEKDADILAAFLNEGVTIDAIQRIDQSYDLQDLIQGRTDAVSAYVTNEPWQLLQHSITPGIISPRTYGVDFYSDCLFTTEREIEEHPQRVEKFLKTSLQGWQYAMSHSEEIIDILLADYGLKKSRDHLRYEADSIRKIMMPGLVEIGYMNPGRWRHIGRTFVKLGMMDANFSLEGFLYNPHPGMIPSRAKWIIGAAMGISLLVSIGALVLLLFNRKLSAEIAERKSIEEELRSNEEKLRNIVENSTNLFYSHTAEHELTYLSPQCREFLQCEPEEAMIRWTEFATDNPINQQGFALTENAIRTAEQQPPYELELKGKKGRSILVEVRESPVVKNGRTVAIVGSLTDITERKRAEKALQDLYETMDLAQKMAGIGFWRYDKGTGKRTWSEQMYAVFGFDPNQGPPSNEDLRRRFLPEDWDRYTRAFHNALEGTPYYIVVGVAFPDGKIHHIDTQGYPRYDHRGNIIGCLGTSQDITERMEAEQALWESEEKYRRIFENSVVGFFQSTPEGRFIRVNPAFAKMLLYESPEDLVAGVSDIATQYYADPEDRCRYQQMLQQLGFVENFEFKVRRKDGSQIWVSNSTRAYFGEQGNIVRYEGIVVDINQRKKAEKEKEELQSQLLQARKMESIGTLAGGIAHEFNNILGIIIGNAELAISDVSEGHPARNYLQEIRNACLRAKEVVKQILRFVRKMPSRKKPVQIRAIVQESLKLVRSTISQAIRIDSEILSESEMILANPTEINQVIINLCTNAVHALADETGTILVRLESLHLDESAAAQSDGLTSGTYVKLSVTDNGSGIQPQILDRIFEPYFTTKDVDKGLGMGLSVVYGIVKNCDGAIHVNSDVGLGTTVEVLLPVIATQTEVDLEKARALPTGTERILFIDDEPGLVSMTRHMLQRLGYRVEGTTSSVEALQRFGQEPEAFDLVITDMAMPEMTGAQLAEELIQLRPEVPVILCTGYSSRLDEDQATRRGIAAYIDKPLMMEKLAQTVRKTLDGVKTPPRSRESA